jgi:hypothetical protein
VLNYVRDSAAKTGRIWAITFDIAGMKTEKIYDALTRDWKKLVDEGVTNDPSYIREGGKPVVEIFGFYRQATGNYLTTEVANQLLDFMKAPGPYAAYVVGGGDWDWRRNTDPEWQAMLKRLDAYSPWNPGNTSKDSAGTVHASMDYWAEDKQECERRGQLWLPVVYPGFSWDNLQRKPPGATLIPRRKGQFLWEQFHELSKLGANSVCVAMFDEVDEATAIYKVTNETPVGRHFANYEGMAPDWYLTLTGAATRMIRGDAPPSEKIPETLPEPTP